GTFTLTTGVSVWPNTQYDDGTDLVTMDNNKYANLWFYLEPDGDLVMLYGTAQYNQSALAELESPPSTIPLRISTHSFLAARLIFQKSASAAEEINSVFTTVFSPTLVSDHGNLAGLTDDDHTQYTLEDGTRAFSGNISHGGFNITSVGTLAGTLSTATQNSVTTMTGLTTIGTLIAGAVPASLVTAGTFGTGDYVFDSKVTVENVLFDNTLGGNVAGPGIYGISNLLTLVGGTSGTRILNQAADAVNFIILDGGNVGIGKEVPSALLHIDNGDSTGLAQEVLRIESKDTSATSAGIKFYADAAVSGGIFGGRTSGSERTLDIQHLDAQTASQPALRFYTTLSGTGLVERMSILAGGNIDFKTGTTKFNTVEYTWPASDGGVNNVLTTNGTGGLSWTAGGGGALGGSGTAGTISKWSAASTLTDSIITESGVTVTVATTLNATNLGGTLSTAAQGNVTSLGTLVALTVDNIAINGNTISSIAGTDLLITPLGGQQIVLDGAVTIDGSVVTGITSLSSDKVIVSAADGIVRSVANATTILSGGTTNILGANIVLYGQSHASQAADWELRSATTVRLDWDESDLEFTVHGGIVITGDFTHQGTNIGFFNTAVQPKQQVLGSRSGGAALTNLLIELAQYGLIIDGTSA
ncbi:hypothetical protein LCGC14_2106100, partial [marine sediment metagenome]